MPGENLTPSAQPRLRQVGGNSIPPANIDQGLAPGGAENTDQVYWKAGRERRALNRNFQNTFAAHLLCAWRCVRDAASSFLALRRGRSGNGDRQEAGTSAHGVIVRLWTHVSGENTTGQ